MVMTLREWIKFEKGNDKIKKLKELGLLSTKALVIKKFLYKGIYTDVPMECDVIGYVDDNEIILSINDELHSIHPDYLKQMQSKNFSRINLDTEE